MYSGIIVFLKILILMKRSQEKIWERFRVSWERFGFGQRISISKKPAR